MKRALCLLTGFVLLAPLTRGQSTPVPDQTAAPFPPEALIRTMYDRLTFFTELGPVATAATHYRHRKVDGNVLDQQVKAAAAKFELSGFHVGPYNELLSLQWGDAITLVVPPVKSLHFDQQGMNYEDPSGRGTWNSLRGSWLASQPASPLDMLIFHHTVGELLQSHGRDILGGHEKDSFTSYVSYNVRAQFGGDQAFYRAVLLIGKDASGGTTYVPIDPVTDIVGMNSSNEYPTALLKTDLRKATTTDGVPFVENFFQDRVVRGSTCKRGGMCVTGWGYGISAEDLDETRNAH